MAHHTRLRRRSALVATLTAALLLGGEAAAQDYPERPVTWLIAFGAGGGTDIFARTTGQLLNQEGLSDATFIYENRPGGSGVRALLDLIHQQEGNDHMLFPFQDVVIVPALQGDRDASGRHDRARGEGG
jgi:putative tricarboxylic transport membrane protein